MSRIRSIHPGLFTDEAFMSASIEARMFVIGLWTEAWDDGVFEWKPLTLKARIFPVDAVNIEGLLGELTGLGFIGPFQANGKKYGAIRNFQKWQRPKKPNSSGVLPPDLVSYVGECGTVSEPVPNQFGTDGEKPPQREDVGGMMEEGKKEAASAACAREPISSEPDPRLRDLRTAIVRIFDAARKPTPATGRAAVWLAQGYDPAIIVAVIDEVLRRNPSVTAISYFDNPIREAHDKRAPAPPPDAPKVPTIDMVRLENGALVERSKLEAAIAAWDVDRESWWQHRDRFGMPPKHPACGIPRELWPAEREVAA